MTLCTSILIFGLACGLLSGQAQNDPPSLSVCEALVKRRELAGKQVTVHGKVHRGKEVFALLPIEKCGDPTGESVTPAIWLGTAQEYADSESLKRLHSRLGTPRPEGPNVEATIEGTFQAAEEYQLFSTSPKVVFGLGHLGKYYAQIRMKRVVLTGK